MEKKLVSDQDVKRVTLDLLTKERDEQLKVVQSLSQDEKVRGYLEAVEKLRVLEEAIGQAKIGEGPVPQVRTEEWKGRILGIVEVKPGHAYRIWSGPYSDMLTEFRGREHVVVADVGRYMKKKWGVSVQAARAYVRYAMSNNVAVAGQVIAGRDGDSPRVMTVAFPSEAKARIETPPVRPEKDIIAVQGGRRY